MKNVLVEYDERAILSDINWTIRRGESWALVGPNGSGKSTLLSLLDGDNPQAYANEIILFSRNRGSGESIWDLKKRIGWISPELHLHFPEDQTCLETVISGFREYLGCYTPPSSRRRADARRMLARLGMTGKSHTPFGSLSTGLQRMTLLARALVKSPDLLLLDEPCQGLDPVHRKQFLGFLESILQRGQTTMIYVTHVPEEIPRGITRMLHLKDGRISRSGAIPKHRNTLVD